ncbi:MAG: zinc ribbon domain-containing protein [Microcoleus sp.]
MDLTQLKIARSWAAFDRLSVNTPIALWEKLYGKAINDQGWGMFLTMLKYKAEKFGHTYFEIGRFFPSSQLCSETLLPIPILQMF